MRQKLASMGIASEERAGRVVALPVSASEVGAVVGLARSERWIVAPEWTLPEALPRAAVRLSVERLSGVSEVLPADLMAVAGAGVTVRALEERLRGSAMFWPGADGAAPDEHIGDIVAAAPANGTLRGNQVRRYVLGLSAVLADGSLVKAGSRTVKCVTGYDLRQLFVGSCGTLGVITALTLRLEPAARRDALLAARRADFAGLEDVSAAPGDWTQADGALAAGREPAVGALAVLRRLKAELDPGGVFPPAEAAFMRRG